MGNSFRKVQTRMNLRIKPKLALQQQFHLCRLLAKFTNVIELQPVHCPNAVFIEDLLLFANRKFYVAKPLAREMETALMIKDLKSMGWEFGRLDFPIEGRDVLEHKNRVFVGSGRNTFPDKKKLEEMYGKECVEIKLPAGVTHLKNIASVVDDLLLLHPAHQGLATEFGLKTIQVEHPNVIQIENDVIAHEGVYIDGYRMHRVDISEIEKAEGTLSSIALKC